MFKSKTSERVQEVILPDFPDDETTVPTVSKSRRVSFGTNFVKEFIVGSAVSGQCLPEYEQAFPSSDSSTADSSHSAVDSGVMERSTFAVPHDIHKVHKPVEADFAESRPKLPKFSSTVCFSADSPTADMEFTEGCITLAKSILDKKNKEMTVIIQAKPKGPKDEEKPKEDESKYFEGSQFEMSMTRCLKSKGNKREEKRFECEKTKIFSKYENEMSVTRCNRLFNEDDSDASWEECKENRMPLDMIMRHLDKENSDLENDLFNTEKKLDNFFNADGLDLTIESEKLNLSESMDISADFQVRGARNLSEESAENPMGKSVHGTSFHEVAEKSLASAPADDKMDKSADELSITGRQLEKIQSPAKTDCKMNKSVAQDSEELVVRDTTQSFQVRPMECDKLTQQVCEESEKAVESTDQKVSESTGRNESEEFVRESLVLDLPPGDRITESEEQARVDQPPDDSKLSTSTDRMSLDGSDVVLTPVKGVTEETNVANKSPEPMILDDVVPSEIVDSLADIPSDDKINKSALAGTEDIIREQSLMDLTSTDKVSESTEPKAVDLPSADQIIVSGEPKGVDLPSTDQMSVSAEPKVVDLPPNNQMSVSAELKVVDLSSVDQMSVSAEPKVVDLPSTDQMSVSAEPKPIEPKLADLPPAEKISESTEQMLVDLPPAEPEPSTPEPTPTDKRQSVESLDETEREPSLVDLKVIESLKEQSKEAGCVWSLKDLRHPQNKTQGWLSFNCRLLESTTGIRFGLRTTNEDSPVACSIVTDSEINLNEENQLLQLPEYRLVVQFGFDELQKYFGERRTQVETIRHVPYFLDQINSFVVKMNGCLRQIYSVLTMYPGSRLEGSRLSFRLFSFPIFFSSTVSIDLSNYFRLSKSSLSFDTDLGSLDENKIGRIFEDCLKRENSLCEFIVQSTKYLVDLEKESGYVSKRGHIRLLPAELRL